MIQPRTQDIQSLHEEVGVPTSGMAIPLQDWHQFSTGNMFELLEFIEGVTFFVAVFRWLYHGGYS